MTTPGKLLLALLGLNLDESIPLLILVTSLEITMSLHCHFKYA